MRGSFARLAATRPQPLSPTEASARTDLNKLAHHGFLDVISGKDRAPEDFVKLTDYQSRMVAGQWFGGGDSASLASKLLADSFRAGGPLHDDASAQEIETSLRRPLWELFYPLVQYRTNPLEAARVVAASLAAYQSEVEITLLYGGAFAHRKLAPIPRSALYAASMRALGVPTRETATGEIEIFSGQGWSPAPQIDDITFKEIQPPKL